MNDTPVLTNHARQRCAEMGISTKVAKHIVCYREVTRTCNRPGETGGWERIATWSGQPLYAVVFSVNPWTKETVILTVLFREKARYERQGEDYAVAG